ncbi:MAG: tRNA uridine(34) 5-carboxymethylaminomethyl modification radical SAM/GNAT enzyme Elp3 [Thermoanaerobaculia bacterium]|jgi:elongator complex protein 3
MQESTLQFEPEVYERQLAALIAEIEVLELFDQASYESVLRRYPKDGSGFFSKSEIIQGFRYLSRKLDWARDEVAFLEKLRMKPVRTLSGVAPVTVLTKPYPCPGKCIFCPSDVRMPKSYLSDEPGAQRAAQYQFDPFNQSLSRLLTYHNTGHNVDKAEVIVLGGTWSSYPEAYRIWFVKRCFDALNAFSPETPTPYVTRPKTAFDFRDMNVEVDGRSMTRSYNSIVAGALDCLEPTVSPLEEADWGALELAQKRNESAVARSVGLVVETRPDNLHLEEVLRTRRLGATKVQIGYQSLSDRVLALNRRGHDVADIRRATKLLRQAGFKIHAHWMPNLLGSTPELDVEDFERLFDDPDFRPDELKIYPCSLVESAELMGYYERREWLPYSQSELTWVLTECLRRTPEYCRITRVIRDIPGTDIVTGNKVTNLRQVAEEEIRLRGLESRDIRAREIRHRSVDPSRLTLRRLDYDTGLGREVFLQFVTPEDRIAAFLRLSLPARQIQIPEIESSAMIREVHVYGHLAAIGQRQGARSQHLGLGRRLIRRARKIATEKNYRNLAVISAVGTRPYYRRLGFSDGPLYQHLELNRNR